MYKRQTIDGSALGSGDTFSFSGGGLFFAAGQTIFLEELSGDGFGLETFTIEFSPVPEPTSALMFGSALLFMVRRKRH